MMLLLFGDVKVTRIKTLVTWGLLCREQTRRICKSTNISISGMLARLQTKPEDVETPVDLLGSHIGYTC